MQPLRNVAMHCAEHDVEMQVHWIFTEQNSLADMLLRG